MKRNLLLITVFILGTLSISVAQTKETGKNPQKEPNKGKETATDHGQGKKEGHDEMTTCRAEDLKWSDGPATLPAGAKISVLHGDPTKGGQFTIRLKFPAGYKVMPHWHSKDEHVTVLQGAIAVGMGEKVDESSMKELPVGGFVVMPAKMRHYAMAKEETIIQMHGMGPFDITYINPADDPRKK